MNESGRGFNVILSQNNMEKHSKGKVQSITNGESPPASELCDLWGFYVTPPIRNAWGNLNQVEVCHFQTDAGWMALLEQRPAPPDQMWGAFLLQEKEKLIVAGARLTRGPGLQAFIKGISIACV